MKLLILIGMIIIFITSYFIIALGNFIIVNAVVCEELPFKPDFFSCRLDALSSEMFIAAILIISFLLMDIGTLYLIITNWVS
ncbi:MAG: hypothetical protein JSV63_01635 [Candidatus Aenigmatarchaeota archaeon]|nr:MAG: hypothetical protein JSV63_01635 [Candidatus Aenigmarchaeota archaeon]